MEELYKRVSSNGAVPVQFRLGVTADRLDRLNERE
jgi:hypothetical protein